MLIGPDYLLKKPDGPSAPKVFFDTQIVPVAANVAGGCEVTLDQAARRLGVRPLVLVAGALSLAGMGLARLSRMRRARQRSLAVKQPPLREIALREIVPERSEAAPPPQGHPDRPPQGQSRADLAAERAPGPRTPGEDLRARQEQLLDEAIEETFPASDPIAPKRITR